MMLKKEISFITCRRALLACAMCVVCASGAWATFGVVPYFEGSSTSATRSTADAEDVQTLKAPLASSGQFAYTDENGNLATPPPEVQAELATGEPATAFVETKSSIPGGGFSIDTRHVRAHVFARQLADGTVVKECERFTDGDTCDLHDHSQLTLTKTVATNATSKQEKE